MNNNEFDEIHDFDYNKGVEESEITSNEIIENNEQDETPPIIEAPTSERRSLFSPRNENKSESTVFDNQTTMDMMQNASGNLIDADEQSELQNFPAALTAGLITSVLCILAWALITVAIKYQIAYMAIGVGVAIGFSIQKFGKGVTNSYKILGAVLALLTCFVGNFVSSVCFVANELNMGYGEIFSSLDPDIAIFIIKESFNPIDLIFYGIAVYSAFQVSTKSLS